MCSSLTRSEAVLHQPLNSVTSNHCNSSAGGQERYSVGRKGFRLHQYRAICNVCSSPCHLACTQALSTSTRDLGRTTQSSYSGMTTVYYMRWRCSRRSWRHSRWMSQQVDVTSSQETKLLPKDKTLEIPQYRAAHCDRPIQEEARGGCLNIYICVTLAFSAIYPAAGTSNVLEKLAVVIPLQRQQKILVNNWYLPPGDLQLSTKGRFHRFGI